MGRGGVRVLGARVVVSHSGWAGLFYSNVGVRFGDDFPGRRCEWGPYGSGLPSGRLLRALARRIADGMRANIAARPRLVLELVPALAVIHWFLPGRF